MKELIERAKAAAEGISGYDVQIAEAGTAAEIIAELVAKLQAQDGEMDVRPANCRFRLQDEGKPYGRSSCSACGKGIFSGLGNQCSVAPDLMAELVEALRECTEWMERLRASGDAGFWDWEDDEYTRAAAVLAKIKEQTK